jgi:hypothetical protein
MIQWLNVHDNSVQAQVASKTQIDADSTVVF